MTGHRYELRVAGRLSERARGAFPHMAVTLAPTETVICTESVDESAIHGLLALCRALGLEVTSFRRASQIERRGISDAGFFPLATDPAPPAENPYSP